MDKIKLFNQSSGGTIKYNGITLTGGAYADHYIGIDSRVLSQYITDSTTQNVTISYTPHYVGTASWLLNNDLIISNSNGVFYFDNTDTNYYNKNTDCTVNLGDNNWYNFFNNSYDSENYYTINIKGDGDFANIVTDSNAKTFQFNAVTKLLKTQGSKRLNEKDYSSYPKSIDNLSERKNEIITRAYKGDLFGGSGNAGSISVAYKMNHALFYKLNYFKNYFLTGLIYNESTSRPCLLYPNALVSHIYDYSGKKDLFITSNTINSYFTKSISGDYFYKNKDYLYLMSEGIDGSTNIEKTLFDGAGGIQFKVLSKKLPTPIVSKIDYRTIRINKVEGANGYDIYCNNKIIGSISNNFSEYKDFIININNFIYSTNDIYVKAYRYKTTVNNSTYYYDGYLNTENNGVNDSRITAKWYDTDDAFNIQAHKWNITFLESSNSVTLQFAKVTIPTFTNTLLSNGKIKIKLSSFPSTASYFRVFNGTTLLTELRNGTLSYDYLIPTLSGTIKIDMYDITNSKISLTDQSYNYDNINLTTNNFTLDNTEKTEQIRVIVNKLNVDYNDLIYPNKFQLYIDGVLKSTFNYSDFTDTKELKFSPYSNTIHSVELIALFENNKIFNSDRISKTITIGKVKAPTITLALYNINEVKATCSSDYSNTDYYFRINEGNWIKQEYTLSNNNIYIFKDLKAGDTYKIESYYVVNFTDGTTIESEIGSSSITISKMTKPNISANYATGSIEWNYDNGSRLWLSGFNIYQNDTLVQFVRAINDSTMDFSYRIPLTVQPGTYTYKVIAVQKSIETSYDPTIFNSDPSTVEITIQVIDIIGKEISWKDGLNGHKTSIINIPYVEHASYFKIYDQNNLLIEQINANTSGITEYNGIKKYIGDLSGEYDFYVIVGSSEALFREARFENFVTYNVSKLKTPVIKYQGESIDNRFILWDPYNDPTYISGDYTSYNIYLNDDLVTRVDNDEQYKIPNNVINGSVYIEAINITQDANYPNPYYLDSDYSNVIEFGKYPNLINLRAEKNKIYWDLDEPYVPVPEKYIVLNYGDRENPLDILDTEIREYQFPTIYEETYSISIYAPAKEAVAESEVSERLMIQVKKLQSPAINVSRYAKEEIDPDTGLPFESYYNLLEFEPIPNASYYKLYINGVEKKIIYQSGTKIDLPVGSTEIRLIACSDGESIYKDDIEGQGKGYLYYTNSDFSNIVIKYIPVDYNYYCVINNEFNRNVDLPFTINLNGDGSLNNGSVSLLLNDDKEPYKTNTDISIRITGTEVNTETIKSNSDFVYNPVTGKYEQNTSEGYSTRYVDPTRYDFLIAGDNVEEVYVNNKVKYRHNITLIDQTKLLEYDILPDLSFTQPVIVTNIQEFIQPDTGDGNLILGSNEDAVIKVVSENFNYSDVSELFVGKRYYTTYTASFNNLKSFPYKSYNKQQKFTLPYFVNNFYTIDKITRYMGLFVKDREEITDSKNYYPTVRYYVRDLSDSYEKIGDEYLICTYNYESETSTYVDENNRIIYTFGAENRPNLSFNQFNIPESLKNKNALDIIMEIDDLDDVVPVFDQGKNAYEKIGTTNLTGMLTSYRFQAWTLKDNMVTNDNKNQFKKFRIVFKGISFNNEPVVDSNAITVIDAIQKCINSIEPLKYNKTYVEKYERAKYILDQSIIDDNRINKLLCPQTSFTNGRSLFEALEELGREFLGIPKLVYSSTSYKTITFEIVNTNSEARVDTDEYLISTESTIENDVTGFVSNISNMITDNSEGIYYPSKTGFISTRATDDSAIIRTDNCGVILDKPIYKLLEVIVTGYASDDRSLDITKFVYENTIYNALNNNPDGKGTALYYSKGDNKIYGLGILPEVDELQASLGLSSENYVINNILYKLTGNESYKNNTGFVKDLKFRIKYVPYTDTQLTLNQFNISEQNNFSYKAYNQTENLVSDQKFGSSVSKQIERLGNLDIQKSYITKSIVKYLEEDGTYNIDSGLASLYQCRIFNNEKYYLNNVSYTFDQQYIQVNCTFSKDFNKINDRIGVNSDYRQYEIELSPTANRVLNFNQYCYIDTEAYKMNEKYGITRDDINPNLPLVIENMLNANPDEYPTQFFLAFKNDLNQNLTYLDYNNKETVIDYGILLPTTKLNIRNAVLLNAKMYDNFSAGMAVDRSTSVDNGFYATKDVRYVDTYGKAFKVNISLCSPILSRDESYALPKYSSANKNLNTLNGSIFNGEYVIDKDSSEALSFNWGINFLSLNKNISAHSGLTKYLFKNESYDIYKPHIFAYVGSLKYTDYFNLDQFDDLGEINVITSTNNQDGIDNVKYIDRTIVLNSTKAYDGYCIVYPFSINGLGYEILLSVYKKGVIGENYETDKLYFNLLDDKITSNQLRESKEDLAN